jgi:putative ABC transport system substrate-binding protein
LHERDWIEGRTVAIEYRWAEGRKERAAEIAAEFVRLKVDVILTSGTLNVIAAKEATSVTPIVFALVPDPVGLVINLARPGGNVTGLSLEQTELAGKRLELLREVMPGMRRLGILADAGDPGAMLEMDKVREAAGKLGIDAVASEIRQTQDVAAKIDALKGRVEALYVVGNPITATYRIRIGILALGARLPTIFGGREYIEAAGLMSYGPDFPSLFRRSADYVDKILRGTKPGDIPVEQPTKFDLAINLIVAKALGMNIPPTLLARADEVIE